MARVPQWQDFFLSSCPLVHMCLCGDKSNCPAPSLWSCLQLILYWSVTRSASL